MSVCAETVTSAGIAAGIEPAELARLEERICEGAGHLAAATAAWLALIAEFDRRDGWAVWGVRSCAHWLSWRCGLGLTAAREHLRVARALGSLPTLASAFASGQLSYSKVRAATRIATAANEADLVSMATSCTGGQLERLVREHRRAASLDDVNARHSSRSLTWSWAEDGALTVRGRLEPEDGALLIAALDAARAAHNRRTLAQANADALLALAETLLATGPAPASGGDRHQVNIHIDLATLTADDATESDDAAAAAPGPRGAHLENGPGLHPETLRRIACDSAAAIITHATSGSPGTSMDIGRRTRVIPAALHRALRLRDDGCAFPSCTATRFVDAHHIRHWAHGGPTDLANLILLCRTHHRAVHEGGYRLTAGPDGPSGLSGPAHAAFTFHRPDGAPIPAVPDRPTGDPDAIRALHHASITADTPLPDWHGDDLDLDAALFVLLRQGATPEADAEPDDSAEAPGFRRTDN